jgi:hypothetical protein
MLQGRNYSKCDYRTWSFSACIQPDSESRADDRGHGRQCDIRPEHISEAIQYRSLDRNLMV